MPPPMGEAIGREIKKAVAEKEKKEEEKKKLQTEMELEGDKEAL